MTIDTVSLWFARAIPAPTHRTFDIQNGVHAEEYGEYLAALVGSSEESEITLRNLQEAVERFATALKSGKLSVKIGDRKAALDAICDQIVTAAGCGHMADLKVAEALKRVNESNWSKFNEDGFPVFDANGKIAKGPNYKKPDLEGLY